MESEKIELNAAKQKKGRLVLQNYLQLSAIAMLDDSIKPSARKKKSDIMDWCVVLRIQDLSRRNQKVEIAHKEVAELRNPS